VVAPSGIQRYEVLQDSTRGTFALCRIAEGSSHAYSSTHILDLRLIVSPSHSKEMMSSASPVDRMNACEAAASADLKITAATTVTFKPGWLLELATLGKSFGRIFGTDKASLSFSL